MRAVLLIFLNPTVYFISRKTITDHSIKDFVVTHVLNMNKVAVNVSNCY
jgi:hypothetical protein